MNRVVDLLFFAGLGYAASVEGVVRDSEARPLRGVSVALGKELAAQTDAEGKYRFDGVPAGSFTLHAQKAGYVAAAEGPFSIGENETRQIDVQLLAVAFFDEPNFVVAGVTDSVNRGGHGSEAVVRSTEAMARAAAALTKDPAAATSIVDLQSAMEREPERADVHHELAVAYEKRGNALEAAREYQRAAELEASENNLFDWGTELLTHRAPEQSMEVFAKGHRLFPRSARMLLGLGAALYAQGSYDKAAERFFEAVDLNPDDPGPYLFLGRVDYIDTSQAEGKTARMERFSKMQPESALANYFYALSLSRSENRSSPRIETLLRKALRIDPKLADAHLELGDYYASVKAYSKAIASYKNAIESGTSHEQAYYKLGQAYRQTGDTASARRAIDRYRELQKTVAAEEERKRREIQQFIFELRAR